MAKTQAISQVLGDLFRAPLKAAAEAERDYLEIWADWVEIQVKLIGDQVLTPEQITNLLNKAPTVKLDGFVDVGISMRIATVKQKDYGFGVGVSGASLGLAPVYASGSFGFSKTSSQESMFQASARFNVSNNNADLTQFLIDRGKNPVDVGELKGVSELLRQWKLTDYQV